MLDERRCGVRNLNVQLGIPNMIVNIMIFIQSNIKTPGMYGYGYDYD